MLTRIVEAFLRTKLNAEKLVRKLERLAEVAAAKVRKAAESQVAREEEAPSPTPAPVQAEPRRPVVRMSETISGAPLPAFRSAHAGDSLARLREEALSSTSALTQSAMEQPPIVSPLLNPLDSPPNREEFRAAA
jgi:hypothetical protein